jgi:tetratricopeptide (TPR) repeat protein
LAHVGEILALAPDFCHALRVKGKCHLLKGDFQGALELLVKANEIDRPWAYHLTMEAIALAGLGRPGEALAKIEESVAENPQPTWGITDQAQALNATVALSISRQCDAAFEWLARTAHIFSNSFNPHLFEILDGFPALDPIRGDERYGRQKEDYLASFTRDAGGSGDERKQ